MPVFIWFCAYFHTFWLHIISTASVSDQANLKLAYSDTHSIDHTITTDSACDTYVNTFN